MASKIDPPLATSELIPLADVAPEELRGQINRIKASERFATSKQLQSLLEMLARRALSNDSKPITQGEIGTVLGLRDFDQTKPTVRIAAARLRSCLMEFYATEGRNDSIIISFPKGRPYRLEAWKKNRLITPRSDQAFQKYNEGRLLWSQRTPETLKKAVGCFEVSIRLDPNYAEPHAALAECYLFMAVWGMAPRAVMPPGRKHAQQAVRISPHSAQAHATLGGILSGYDWDWAKAWKAFDKAIELDPLSVTAYCLRAPHLLSLGNAEAAAQDAHLTLKLASASPAPLINSHVAKILYAAGQYDEAEELLVGVQEMMPNFYLVHWQLGLIRASEGDFSSAADCLETANKLSPNSPSIIASVGWVHALSGKSDAAAAIIACLVEYRRQRYVPATDIAMIYGALGEMDLAFRWLKRACRERALFLSWLMVWPPFKNLYSDHRSGELLRRMNLDSPSLRRR